jgi:hypothetical protein
MRAGIIFRLRRLETTKAARLGCLRVEYGNVKELPKDHVGQRHVATIAQNADGTYEWEERPGPAPASDPDEENDTVIRVCYIDVPPKSPIQ